MSILVHPASTHDSIGTEEVIGLMKGLFHRLSKILAGGGIAVRNWLMP